MKITSQTSTLFVGLGGVGCMVAKKLHDLGYSCVFVDCDINELNEIEVESKCKYAVKLGDKTEGSRQKGKGYINTLKEELNKKMLHINANAKYVYFVFDMSGGFGGAVAPELLREYTKRFNPENNQKSYKFGEARYFGVIPVMSQLRQNNVLECYNELRALEEVRNYMFLSNKDGDIVALSNKFSVLMDRFFSGGKTDKRGNISEKDMELLMEARGSVFMGEIESSYGIRELDNTPFIMKQERVCKGFCISVGKDIDEIDWGRMKKRWISTEILTHGYTDNENTVIFIFGMRLPNIKVILE